MPINRYQEAKNTTNVEYYFPVTQISERESDLYVQYTLGDRLDYISHKFYGTSAYWWVILLANRKYKVEFDIQVGDIIRIPFPLNDVLLEIKKQL